jgi:o-succinylbenzoate synthase
MVMVKIATLDFHRYSRPLQIPLVTARQTVSQREGLIVRVVAENGVTGLGEAAPLAEYSPDSIDQSERNLTLAAKRSAAKAVPDSLDDISTLVGELIPADNPAARFGLETSLCDAAARCARQSLCRWLGGEDVATIRINYLLDRPVADWRAAADDIKRFGYRAVKVKVGIGSISEDAAFVRRARVELGDDVAIRLDANRAWSYNDAVTALEAIKDIGIEFVEEPLRQSDLGLLPQLRGKTGVPVALDESMAETLFHRGIDAIDMIMTKEMCDWPHYCNWPRILMFAFPAGWIPCAYSRPATRRCVRSLMVQSESRRDWESGSKLGLRRGHEPFDAVSHCRACPVISGKRRVARREYIADIRPARSSH